MASSNSHIPFIILDDYADIARPYFSHLASSLAITSHPETLPPSDTAGLIALLKPYTIISSMRERTLLSSDVLSALPNLKLLLTTGTRNAAISLPAAEEAGIIVAGTTGGRAAASSAPGTDSTRNPPPDDLPPPSKWQTTNQHAWALLLSLCARIAHDDAAVRQPGSTAWQSGLGIPLGGKTLGVLGFGRLGVLMARTAILGFGMEVVAWSANLTQERADEACVAAGLERGCVRVVQGKEELLKVADVVSVHYVLSERSRGLIGKAELAMMKKSALLVNTSRGPLVDEDALLEVLRKGAIRGAALDVYCEEPLSSESPWRTKDGFRSEVVLSPHMGYVYAGTMQRWYEEQAENIQRWLNGEEVMNRMA